MIWKKFTLETTEEAEELLSLFLEDHGAEGVQIEDKKPLSTEELKEMYVDIPLVQGEDDGKAWLSCYLKPDFDVEGLKKSVSSEIQRLSQFLPVGTGEITVTDTEDDATWQNHYKDFFRPFRLSEDIVIEPSWEEYPEKKSSDHVVRIESVMAFGTGTHETTKLCIGAIRKYLQRGDSLLDVGCGSGILAITAVSLGAGKVCGMDIDPQAVKSSRENASANGLTEQQVQFHCGNLLDRNYILDAGTGDGGSVEPLTPEDYESQRPDWLLGQKYDVVVANILAEVIIPLSQKVRPLLKEGGKFISSGISKGKADRVRTALMSAGFRILEERKLNDWVCFVAE